jgi:hypothetical protein
MNITNVAKILYGLFATVFIIVGLAIVSFKSGLLPASMEESVLHAADHNLNALHSLQEFGSLLVFAGLISFWFIRNYQYSAGFHWSMTAFWALMALVHWADVRGLRPSLVGPIVNTIPFVLFLAVGVMRRAK